MASDPQVQISPNESVTEPQEQSMSVTDAAVERSDCTPHRLAADFDAVIGAETMEDSVKPLDSECNIEKDKIMGNEQPTKMELVDNGQPIMCETSNALKFIHLEANKERESFEAQSSCSGDQSRPMLHRVLERTRVDIIRL